MLRLAEGFSATVDDVPVRLPNRKARALLACLAFAGPAGATREKLAGLLWSDVGDRQARASLRQTLSETRGALAELGCNACVATREAVALDAAQFQLDLAGLTAEIAAGHLPDALRLGRPLEECLLAGFEDLTPLFQDWLLSTRQQVGAQVKAALQAAFADAALDPEQRRMLAEAMLRIDPLHEEACRTVMRLAAEAGETGAALRAYGALYEQLGAELDMEPALPTQELAVAIKCGEVAPLRRGTAPPPMAPTLAPAVAAPIAPGPNPRRSALSVDGTPVVAVLPFRTAPPLDSWFGEGMTEDIVGTLAAIREPVVISASSTRRFRNTEETPSAIAAVLGAEYLVFGSMRAFDNGARVSVELVEAGSGAVIWARGYDVALHRLFETQAQIAASIVAALMPRLLDVELRLSRRRAPEDLRAYHLLLQARDRMSRLDRASLEEAEGLLRRALAMEPRNASIHATIAEWHTLRLFQGWSPDPAFDAHALEASGREALRLDPLHSRALAMCGHNLMLTTRRHDAALEMLERAVDVAPNDSDALIWSVPTLAYVGRPQDAVRRAERALALSPTDPLLFRNEHFRSIAHYAGADYESAAYWGLRAAERNPNYTSNLRITVAALSALGRKADARAMARRVIELQPSVSVSDIVARHVFREDHLGKRYGAHLLDAGMPP